MLRVEKGNFGSSARTAPATQFPISASIRQPDVARTMTEESATIPTMRRVQPPFGRQTRQPPVILARDLSAVLYFLFFLAGR